jgi:hypothetical protein
MLTPTGGGDYDAISMDLSLADHLSEAGLDKWIGQLGVVSAPVPRKNVKTSLAFFHECMPRLPSADALAFLLAMDLSKPVARVRLLPNERVIGFRTGSESPFKLFFTRRGRSMHSSGINTAGRGVVHFVVRAAVDALESYTTGAIDVWTPRAPGQHAVVAPRARELFGAQRELGIMVTGGGLQLIIPQSVSHLLVEQRGS